MPSSDRSNSTQVAAPAGVGGGRLHSAPDRGVTSREMTCSGTAICSQAFKPSPVVAAVAWAKSGMHCDVTIEHL
jgi:hypothetical protein